MININKIEKFMLDEAMVESVYDAIRNSFLKNNSGVPVCTRDINTLAAERIAVDLLDTAWKELSKYKQAEEKKSTGLGQIGL